MEENRINSVGETADTIGGGENLETPHKRRVRYKGTHPRSYKEKYKELQPEKYGDTIAKVISKGSTPAGMHISIMVKEILDFLNIQPGQTGLDATLGYGGHTSHMLACLKGEGHMYALDVDTIEMEKTRKRLADKGFGPDILTIKHLNFANIDQVAEEAGGFDFVLADLGVSSAMLLMSVLGLPRAMWAGIACMSVCLPFTGDCNERAEKRGMFNIVGSLLFVVLYLALPTPPRQ